MKFLSELFCSKEQTQIQKAQAYLDALFGKKEKTAWEEFLDLF